MPEAFMVGSLRDVSEGESSREERSSVPFDFFGAAFVFGSDAGAAASVAGLPFLPKKVVSRRCIFLSASVTEDSVVAAMASAVTGRSPAGRASTRQRLSA